MFGASPAPAPPSGDAQSNFPKFDRSFSTAPGLSAPVYNIGDKRSLFEDKVAISSEMRYAEDSRRDWLKTTTNYLISKAYEMKYFLPWAESAQSQVINESHVEALKSTEILQ